MENQMGCETNGKQPHAMEPVKQQLTRESVENHVTVRLVGVKEMAEILSVKPSWLYQRTRLGTGVIPFVKFGKYLRFEPEKVIEHYRTQSR